MFLFSFDVKVEDKKDEICLRPVDVRHVGLQRCVGNRLKRAKEEQRESSESLPNRSPLRSPELPWCAKFYVKLCVMDIMSQTIKNK